MKIIQKYSIGFITFFLIVLFGKYFIFDFDQINVFQLIYKLESTIDLIILVIFTLTYIISAVLTFKSNKYLINFIVNSVSLLLLIYFYYFPSSIVKLDDSIMALFVVFIFEFFINYYRSIQEYRFSIKDIVECALFVAIAIILDLGVFKIRIGANGGSISLAMVPLFVYSIRNGFKKGFICSGIVFGLLNCLTDGYGFYSYIFDYLLGFGSISTIGFFKNKILIKNKISYLYLCVGFILSILFRIVFSTISGILFYQLTLIPSLIYQLSYILPSGIACIIILLFLKQPLVSLEKANKNYTLSN